MISDCTASCGCHQMAHKLMKDLSQEVVYCGSDREENLIVSICSRRQIELQAVI